MAVSFALQGFTQDIVNLVFIGKDGVTDDINQAHSFIVIKKYPERYQRIEYKLSAPLIRLRNYSDSLLKILHGPFYEYAPDGSLSQTGYYANNLKEKNWSYYNDTGKVILEEQYEKGILIKTINPDTLQKKPSAVYKKSDKVEIEAQFKEGENDWRRYLRKALNDDVAIKSVNGGLVIVDFTVNKTGACVDVHLSKSVEFVLDEEAIRVIENSPLWKPAVQGDKKVNAYRRQPITFGIKED